MLDPYELRLKANADILRELIDRRVRRSELGVSREDLFPPSRAHLGDRSGPLDPVPELAEILVKEHENGYRLELPLVQVALHDVVVLIAEKDPHVELSAVLREASEHREIRAHVAAPVLG